MKWRWISQGVRRRRREEEGRGLKYLEVVDPGKEKGRRKNSFDSILIYNQSSTKYFQRPDPSIWKFILSSLSNLSIFWPQELTISTAQHSSWVLGKRSIWKREAVHLSTNEDDEDDRIKIKRIWEEEKWEESLVSNFSTNTLQKHVVSICVWVRECSWYSHNLWPTRQRYQS